MYKFEDHTRFIHEFNEDPCVQAYTVLSWFCAIMGKLDKASNYKRLSFDLSERIGHDNSSGYAMSCAILFHNMFGSAEDALILAEKSVKFSNIKGLMFWDIISRAGRGWSLLRLGHTNAGIREIHAAIGEMRTKNCLTTLGSIFTGLANGCQAANKYDDAGAAIDEGLQHVRETGECMSEAELYRMRGQVLLKQEAKQPIEAEQCFERALAIARGQGAKLFELRAAMSLARLWAERGERQRAHDLLAPIYGWFTEGFGTRDLIEAKALLDQLA